MKVLLRVVAVLVLVLVLGAVAALFFIDEITGSAIRKASAYATGVETKLASADLGVTSGTLDLDELVIANPEGFDTDHFFSLGSGAMEVDLSTIRSETVVVPKVVLSDVSIVIEKKDGKANYQVILENLEKLSGEQPAEDQPEEAGAGVNIEELRIENISARIVGYPFPDRPVEVPAIVLHNVPESSTDRATIAKVVGIVISATLKTVIGSIGDLPGELISGVGDGLAQVGDLGDQAIEQVGDVAEQATQQLEQAAQQLEQGTERVGEATEKATQALEGVTDKATEGFDKLGGLLPGKKQDDAGEDE